MPAAVVVAGEGVLGLTELIELKLLARFVELGWVLALVLGLEIGFPRERHPLAARLAAAVFWSVSAAFAVVFSTLFGMAWEALDIKPLFHAGGWMPQPVAYVAGPLLGALIGDFFYWAHRAQHTFFWRFHSIHHSIRHLSALSSYHHWTEEAFRTLLIVIPSSLLVDLQVGPAMPLIVGFLLVHGIYFHSSSRLHFGPFGRVLVDNRYHRVHHSIEPMHFDKNFAAFTPMWDVVFGTYYFPKPGEWPQTGVSDQPEPTEILDYLVRPFETQPPVTGLSAGTPPGS